MAKSRSKPAGTNGSVWGMSGGGARQAASACARVTTVFGASARSRCRTKSKVISANGAFRPRARTCAGSAEQCTSGIRPSAVPAKLVQQPLRRALWRAGVACGQDGAEPVTALGIRLDAPPQVVLRLRRIEEGVAAERIRVPDIHDCAGDGFADGVAHLAAHEQSLALFAAVVEPRFALRKRRSRDIKRPFNGARRAALDAGLSLGPVHPHVEEGFKAEARHQQPGLVRLAERCQVAHRRPELVGLNVKLLDRPKQVRHDAMYDALQPSIATVVIQTAHLAEQVLYGLCVQQRVTHGRSLHVRSQPRSPPATGKVTPVM